MNLKYLSFSHIKGFEDLSVEQKDEFISLYKSYVLNTQPYLRGNLSESKIISVYMTRQYNYRTSFLNRPDIVLKPEKKRSVKPEKENRPSTQIRIYDDTHKKIKEVARDENKGMIDILDEACSLFLEYRHNNNQ